MASETLLKASKAKSADGVSLLVCGAMLRVYVLPCRSLRGSLRKIVCSTV